jgi:hypothetical protein
MKSYTKLEDINIKDVKSIALKSMLNNPLCLNYIDQINNLIQNTIDYVDSNFWSKDPIYNSDNNYYSKLWEMIMINYFLKKGAKVVKTKDKNLGRKNGSPDIKIELEDGRVLWVECVVASIGDIPIEKFYQGNYGGDLEEYNKAKIIRLSNSIDEKNKKLNKYLDNCIISNQDLFLVAINTCEYQDTHENYNLGRVLYGKAEEVLTFDIIKREYTDSHFKGRYGVNKKKANNSQTILKTDLFLNTSTKLDNLIGILYSGFNGIASINRDSFTVGFDNNFKQYEKYIENLFDRYYYLEDSELMQKL